MERVEYGTDGNPYKLFVSTGIENKEQFPTVIPKADYENRLKADMVAVLDKLRAEIEKAVWEDSIYSRDGADEVRIPRLDPDDVFEIIDKYKAESEDN